MAELSIIVTAYRVERYLRDCVDSLLGQAFRNLEIILVDDGSPDGCPEICDAYAKKDARVKVIHQENRGSVLARRAGLLAASGDYVTFVDGDDRLVGEMYAPMMALAEAHGADMVISGYVQGNENANVPRQNAQASGVYRGERLRALKDRALFTGKYYEPGIVPALWNKVIRRELLLSLGEVADGTIKMGDDAAITYPLIGAATCVVVDNGIRAYLYRETEGSLSRSFDPGYFDRAFSLIEGLRARLAGDAAMLAGLDYYALFILEVGFGQMIGARGNPLAARAVIAAQIERFDLPKRLAGIDGAAVGERVMKRVRLLRAGRPGRYMLNRIFEMLRMKLGSGKDL